MTPTEEKKFTMAAAAYVAVIAGLFILAWALAKPAHADFAKVVDSIDAIVTQSACSKYAWKNRGVGPIGYFKGMARTYSKDYCQWVSPATTAAGQMGKALGSSTSLDALTRYKANGKINPVTGLDRLRSDFTLLIGLGMRESSGAYCVGRDYSNASSNKADTCEAGPFQVSYNSHGASPWLATLWDEYKAHPENCNLATWKEGVILKDEPNCASPNFGTGIGSDFQTFSRTCPGFAAEYAAVGIRFESNQWGPLNSIAAEFKQECLDMLKAVEGLGCK